MQINRKSESQFGRAETRGFKARLLGTKKPPAFGGWFNTID
jgi:hypothetical protein